MNLVAAQIIIGLAIFGMVAGIAVPAWRLRGREADATPVEFGTATKPFGETAKPSAVKPAVKRSGSSKPKPSGAASRKR